MSYANSTTVDEKVVEMRFDNKNFEKNVAESQRTIDKLMSKLKFKGASKGFEDIEKSAKKVNFGVITNGLDDIKVKFSALDVMQARFFSNIMDSVYRTGTKLLKSLSVDQIEAGWGKLNEKTSSIQTIMNATGKSIDQVNGYLDQLMWFSDETSYSFTNMTAALAQMTSSGGDIDKLVPMITGIANATAFAGKGAREFESTIRNLSQSYSSGHLNLVDMKSLDLMGTSSKQLKEAFIQAAENQNKIEKGSITVSNFSETLAKQWADTEVMEEALGRFASLSSAAYEAVKAGEFDTASEAIESLSKSLKMANADYDDLGEKAFKAAQEAKTFSEVIDATKDAVSSSWMQTFNNIFGDFTQSKQLWTKMANEFWEIFAGGGESRNDALAEAFGSQWGNLKLLLDKVGKTADDFSDSLSKVYGESSYEQLSDIIDRYGDLNGAFENGAIKGAMVRRALAKLDTSMSANGNLQNYVFLMENLETVVNDIASGKWGDADEQIKRLEEAGYNATEVQNLVNKTIHNQKIEYDKLNPEIMLAATLSQAQANSVLTLNDAAEDAEINLEAMLRSFNKASNRQRIFNSIGRTLEHVAKVISAVREGFRGAFSGNTQKIVTSFADGLETFANRLDNSEEHLAKISRVANGFGKVLKVALGIGKSVFRLGESLIRGVVRALGGDFGSLSDRVLECSGSMLDWISRVDPIGHLVDRISGFIDNASESIRTFISNNRFLNSAFSGLTQLFTSLNTVGSSTEEIVSKAVEVVFYLAKGLWDGAISAIDAGIDIGEKLGESLITGLKGSLDIHSPSKKGAKVGSEFVSNLMVVAKSAIDTVTRLFRESVPGITKFINEVEWGNIFATGVGIIIIDVIRKFSKNFEKLVNPIEVFASLIKGINSVFSSISKAFLGLAKYLRAKAFASIAEGIVELAKAFAIIAGTIIVISSFPTEQLKAANSTVIVVASVLGSMVLLATIFSLVAAKLGIVATGQMLSIGTAFIMIAGALESLLVIMALVGFFPDRNIDKAVKMFNGIAYMLSVIILCIAIMGAAANSASKLAAISLVMLALQNFIVTTATVLGLLSFANSDALVANAIILGAVVGGLIFALEKIASLDIRSASGAAKVIMALSACLMIMSISLRMIAGDGSGPKAWGQLARGVIGMVVIVGALLVLIRAMDDLARSPSKNITKFARAMLILSSSMLVLAVAIRIIGSGDWSELLRGVIGLTSCIGGIWLLLLALQKLNKFGNSALSGAKTILAMSASLIAMSVAVRMLGNTPSTVFYTALKSMALLGLIFAEYFATMRLLGGKQIAGVAKNLLAMSASVAILAVLVALFGWMEWDNIGKGLAVIGACATLVSGMVAVLNLTTKPIMLGSENAHKTLWSLAGLIGMFGLVIIATTFMTEEQIRNAIKIVSIVGLAISGMLAAVSLLNKGDHGKNSWMAVLQIVALIGALAGMVFVLNKLDPTSAIEKASALSILIIALSGAVAVMSMVSKTMTAGDIVGVLAEIVMMLLAMDSMVTYLNALDPDGVIQKAGALSILLITMGVLLVTCSLVGNNAIAALPGMAIVALAVLAIGGVLNIVLGFKNLKSDNILQTVKALSIMLLSLSAAFVVLGLFGSLAPVAITGAVGLIAVVSVLGLALAGFGALCRSTDIEGLINDGIPLLCLIAQGLGEAFGAFITGFAGGIAASMEVIGSGLNAFAEDMVTFSDTMSNINPGMLDGLKSTIGAVILVAGAEFISAVSKFATLGLGGLAFKRNLETLVESIGSVADKADEMGITTLTAAKVRSISGAGKAVAEMIAAMPKEGGLFSMFGGNSMDSDTLAKGLTGMLTAIEQFTEASTTHMIDINKVRATCDAGTEIIRMAKQIPKEGGLVGKVLGDSTISDITTSMGDLALGIVAFSNASGDVDIDKVQNGVDAGDKILDMAKHIPNSGGMLADIVGDNDMGEFCNAMRAFATGIAEFSNACGDVNTYQVTNAANAGVSIAKMMSLMPKTNGIWQKITGDNAPPDDLKYSVGLMGKAIVAFGDAISKSKSTISAYTIKTAADAGLALVDMLSKWPSNMAGQGTILAFTTEILNMAQALVMYSEKIKDIDISAINDSVDTIGNLSSALGTNSGGLKGLVDKLDLGSLGNKISESLPDVKNSAKEVADAVSAELDPKTVNGKGKGFSVGYDYGMGVLNGINSQAVKGSLTVAITKLMDGLKTTAEGRLSKFVSIGEYIDDGIVQGVKNHSHIVNNSLTKLVLDAYEAGRKAGVIRSPSRLFENGVGKWIPLGIAKGVELYGWAVTDAVETTVVKPFESAREQLSKLAVLAADEIHVSPTVRPICDLSEIQNGARRIGDMFRTVSVMAYGIGNVKSSASRSAESDAALMKAISTIAKTGSAGDTYNINGITYDSESTVGKAVSELVSALRIDRRS